MKTTVTILGVLLLLWSPPAWADGVITSAAGPTTGLPPEGAEGDCLLVSSGVWAPGACPGAGSGAPTDATYLTQTANGTLSAEQALGALGTGLMLNTTTTGVVSIYGGISCSNKALAGLNGSGSGTCSTITSAFVDSTVWTGTASSGLLKASSQGVLTAATVGTDYVTGASTNTFTNKTLDCNGTGNACSNIDLTADVTGVAPVANGGTGVSTLAVNQLLVGTDTDVIEVKTLPSCSNGTTSKLLYNSTTQAFSCGTDQDTGGGGGPAGVIQPTIVTVNAGNAPYTALSTDLVLLCDTTAAGRTINLPAASQAQLFKVKNLGANSCTIARAGSDTIDGATSAVLTLQYEAIELVADGTSAWSIF